MCHSRTDRRWCGRRVKAVAPTYIIAIGNTVKNVSKSITSSQPTTCDKSLQMSVLKPGKSTVSRIKSPIDEKNGDGLYIVSHGLGKYKWYTCEWLKGYFSKVGGKKCRISVVRIS